MRTSSYSVKTAVLYYVLKTMWKSCKTNREAMSEMRGIYTDEFIDTMILQIAAAEALPDDAARSATHEQIRMQMEPLATICCSNWRLLKMCIRNSSPESEREIMYTAAGWGDYESAAHNSWTSVISMMQQGSEFIAKNYDILFDEGKNMPENFPDLYNASSDAFISKYDLFIEARQTAEIGTAQKIEANNAIYRKTIDMGLDGQECFYNNDELRKQFTFDAVAGLISPAGASGIVITVTNAETNQPLIAEIVDSVTDRSVSTNSDGRGEMLNLSSGDTTFLITCDGYTQQAINYTLKTGTTGRLEVKMVPIGFAVTGADNVAGNGVPAPGALAVN